MSGSGGTCQDTHGVGGETREERDQEAKEPVRDQELINL